MINIKHELISTPQCRKFMNITTKKSADIKERQERKKLETNKDNILTQSLSRATQCLFNCLRY